MEKIILKIINRILLEQKEDGCWIYKNPNNIKNVRSEGKYPSILHKHIHSIMYEYYFEITKKNSVIHHICQNKKCCNIWHLQELTKAEHSFTHHNVSCRYQKEDGRIFLIFNLEEYNRITNIKKEKIAKRITERITKQAKPLPFIHIKE